MKTLRIFFSVKVIAWILDDKNNYPRRKIIFPLVMASGNIPFLKWYKSLFFIMPKECIFASVQKVKNLYH